jgi:predicted nucleotidyltransferase
MNNTGIPEIVQKEITEFAQKHHIRKVILFGSRARGDYKRTSDIDLAVYGGDILSFAFDIDELTSTLLKFDVVNLDEAVQEELKNAIHQEGIILYEQV